MSTRVQIDGIEGVVLAMDKLPGNISQAAIIGAGKKALRPARAAAKSYLLSQAETFKNERGFSKLRFVAKNIRILPSKNKRNPGVNLYVKGNDLPVGNRFWKLYGYSRLLAFGSADRVTRGTGAKRGIFKAFGDYLKEGYTRTRNQVSSVFKAEIRRELKRAVEKAVRRYGKRY